jgi:hypothetical protein
MNCSGWLGATGVGGGVKGTVGSSRMHRVQRGASLIDVAVFDNDGDEGEGD